MALMIFLILGSEDLSPRAHRPSERSCWHSVSLLEAGQVVEPSERQPKGDGRFQTRQMCPGCPPQGGLCPTGGAKGWLFGLLRRHRHAGLGLHTARLGESSPGGCGRLGPGGGEDATSGLVFWVLVKVCVSHWVNRTHLTYVSLTSPVGILTESIWPPAGPTSLLPNNKPSERPASTGVAVHIHMTWPRPS